MNETVKRKIDTSTLGWGIILIGLGVVFLLQQLDIIAVKHVVRWYWPMILVIIGLPSLFDRKKVWSGLWLITLGAWMQVTHLRMFGLTWRTSWPLLLIAVGAGMTLRALIDAVWPKEKPAEQPPQQQQTKELGS
jgi:hypothetical protein